ncbi:MAG: 50S ribosomal protein L25 [Desulfoplanes sp.]
MAELLKFHVEGRTERGKGPNRRVRKQGMVPGVYYDADGHNIPVKMDFIALSKLYSSVGCSKVFELEIVHEGKTDTKPALIKNIHRHPLKPIYNHVDFFGIDLHKKVTISIPVQVTGKPVGVVAGGGELGIFRETVEVECLPSDIPDSLILDVASLNLGDNILIGDVAFPEGVTPLFEENYAIVGVVVPRITEEEPEPEAETAAATEAPAAEGVA